MHFRIDNESVNAATRRAKHYLHGGLDGAVGHVEPGVEHFLASEAHRLDVHIFRQALYVDDVFVRGNIRKEECAIV